MKKIVVVALLSAFVAAPAVAAGNEGQLYAGVKLSDGLGIFGGYTIDQKFSAEAEYTELGSSGYYTNSAIGVSGVYTLAIKPQVSLIGKLGIARATSDYSSPVTTYTSTNTALSLSIAAQYAINPKVLVQGGIQSYTLASGAGNGDSLYIAGVYKF
jgi:hypothetical protein